MSSSAHQPPTRSASDDGTRNGWAAGGLAFGGALMIVYGVLAVLQGITAVAKDDVYARLGDYTFGFDLTSWGWIHLIVGIIVVVTGAGLLSGATWARAVGAVVVGLSIIANFMWLPYQPFWSIVMILTGFFVMWAVLAYRPGRDRW
ncbi:MULTISPECIES: DUF7144 family membrane protein [unclassified Streptomyces]|uniref:DUF7144 family membrane protein n=1 Tax=unclassified Streptomyces TaxID=2593676 RepID=UPI0004C60A4E|nr:hypothetical protein [Streptomyces sp. NRRL S-118]